MMTVMTAASLERAGRTAQITNAHIGDATATYRHRYTSSMLLQKYSAVSMPFSSVLEFTETLGRIIGDMSP